jgi:hypothetical protein
MQMKLVEVSDTEPADEALTAQEHQEIATTYLSYLGDQRSMENDRKKSLEQRGMTVMSVSGGFSILLLGITVFGIRKSAVGLVELSFLGMGVIFFAGAAIFGSLAIQVAEYTARNPRLLADLAKNADDAQDLLEATHVVALDTATGVSNSRSVNNGKARRLRVALFLQMGAIGAYSIGACAMLVDHGSQLGLWH